MMKSHVGKPYESPDSSSGVGPWNMRRSSLLMLFWPPIGARRKRRQPPPIAIALRNFRSPVNTGETAGTLLTGWTWFRHTGPSAMQFPGSIGNVPLRRSEFRISMARFVLSLPVPCGARRHSSREVSSKPPLLNGEDRMGWEVPSISRITPQKISQKPSPTKCPQGVYPADRSRAVSVV